MMKYPWCITSSPVRRKRTIKNTCTSWQHLPRLPTWSRQFLKTARPSSPSERIITRTMCHDHALSFPVTNKRPTSSAKTSFKWPWMTQSKTNTSPRQIPSLNFYLHLLQMFSLRLNNRLSSLLNRILKRTQGRMKNLLQDYWTKSSSTMNLRKKLRKTKSKGWIKKA